MATLHPFSAVRPRPQFVEEVVASVPNEIISLEEARELVDENPNSFMRVIRPEVDLPQEPSHEAVYQKGAENLQLFAESDLFECDREPYLYVYRLQHNGHKQTGIYGCVPVSEYEDGTILRHERTRPDKAEERVRHMVAQKAHTEPAMLIYKDIIDVQKYVDDATTGEPLFDFVDEDEVQHTLWRIEHPEELINTFGAVPNLYLADGHHRCKAASKTAATLRTSEKVTSEVEFFPAVLFPVDQMRIKAYNRVVYNLPLSAADFLAEIEALSVLEQGCERPRPDTKGEICLYLNGNWHAFELPPTELGSISSQLDVARLSEHILRPLLGIQDSRVDENIGFVSGRKGTDHLEALVDGGEADLAISMYPTSIEELIEVSDAGELMPPKSTWFDPKLRSGMLIHVFAKEWDCQPAAKPSF